MAASVVVILAGGLIFQYVFSDSEMDRYAYPIRHVSPDNMWTLHPEWPDCVPGGTLRCKGGTEAIANYVYARKSYRERRALLDRARALVVAEELNYRGPIPPQLAIMKQCGVKDDWNPIEIDGWNYFCDPDKNEWARRKVCHMREEDELPKSSDFGHNVEYECVFGTDVETTLLYAAGGRSHGSTLIHIPPTRGN